MKSGSLFPRPLALLAGLVLAPSTLSATPIAVAETEANTTQIGEGNPFAMFAPTADPINHRIDFEAYDWILKNIVISMGPSTRSAPVNRVGPTGTRIRQGHKSRYRLEGSLVTFLYLEEEARRSLTDYRQELEEVTNTLDISSLPRDEQLAFWFNFHNIALLEQIADNWPTREPGEIKIDGVPLHDSKFLTVRGIPMSLRDIRENIVFANWRNPKVIYGFWRGEIGGPALEREAYTGANVSSLLDIAAEDFVNSMRGTQKRGDRMDVSTLYQETGAFYFPDFENDVRAHIALYANEDVNEILEKTSTIRASLRDHTIADVSGGARLINYLNVSVEPNGMYHDSFPTSRVPLALWQLLTDRRRKLEGMARDDIPTGRVIISNIRLPGDPPNNNAVE